MNKKPGKAKKDKLREYLTQHFEFTKKLVELLQMHDGIMHWGQVGRSDYDDAVNEVDKQFRKLQAAFHKAMSVPVLETDAKGRPVIHCSVCNKKTSFKHLIDEAHGIAGAYMKGSERYACSVCDSSISKGNPLAKKLGLEFAHE